MAGRALSPSHYSNPGLLARHRHAVYVQVLLALSPSGCVLSILPVESLFDVRGAGVGVNNLAVNVSSNEASPGQAFGSAGEHLRRTVLCLATAVGNCSLERATLSPL